MPKRILVVDDSPTIRNVIKLYLGAGDEREIIEAADAERALRLVRLMPVDLVIADVNMPGLDGLEMTRRLRADPQPSIRSLPIILMTAEEGDTMRARAAGVGADEFVKKPVSSASLLGAVSRLLGPGT